MTYPPIPRPALVTDLPDPPELTDEQIAECYEQEREWRRLFDERKREMEIL